jgi:hypothetical protein
MPPHQRADVVRELLAYPEADFRAALRRRENGGWDLHTLVLDALPSSYRANLQDFPGYYESPKFSSYTYGTAAFASGTISTDEMRRLFTPDTEQWLPTPGAKGATHGFTVSMPALQHDVSRRDVFFTSAGADGFSVLRWPHSIYTFHRTKPFPQVYDASRLVAPGCPTYPEFQIALADLIYGESDWSRARQRSFDPQIILRIVREQPYFADIVLRDAHSLSVTVHGKIGFGCEIELLGSGGIRSKMDVRAPRIYSISLPSGLPSEGQLTLTNGGQLVDEFQWNTRYAPVPSGDASTAGPQESERAESTAQPAVTEPSKQQVFLCYNSGDRQEVRRLDEQLRANGVGTWFDERDLRPGTPWIRELQRLISQVGAAAVCVGKSGIGPWQTEEIEAFLLELKKRECPLIPVILPDCEATPALPPFLGTRHWVDFRRDDPDPLRQLIWGVTGERPD